jgi:Xaa-Pro aminopeptidase
VDGADVHWGGDSTIQTAIDELKRRGGDGARIGVIGPLPFGPYEALKDVASAVISLNGAYTRMRLVKSDEELDWFRIGAALSDLAIDALLAELRPGLTEHDLADIVEHAYVPWGGRSGIHFFGTTPMDNPDLYVPAQFTSNRKVRVGDIVFTEITASFFDYGGQVLRSFAVGREPTPIYRSLHEAAEAAYDAILVAARPGATAADLIEAGRVIEEAGFTHCDDLVHGYGGGYFPPVLGLPSRRDEPTPDLTLQSGMMMVVQPNVITRDQTAGVQTGDCIVVTPAGGLSLHHAPRGFPLVEGRERIEGLDDGG